ncbi:hypothetical protein YDYSY3_13010 [Paenibacillus chitinolyticus]|nr:hypothetical protein YDYSY3_13010 [Paenibacillus chitinolyticus]
MKSPSAGPAFLRAGAAAPTLPARIPRLSMRIHNLHAYGRLPRRISCLPTCERLPQRIHCLLAYGCIRCADVSP